MIKTPPKSEPAERPATAGEDLFARVFESLPTVVVVFDRRLQVIRGNTAAKNMLPQHADLSVALSKLTAEGRFEDWAVELRRVMETRLPRRIDVTVRQGDDAGETYLNLLVHPLLSPDGREVSGGVLLAEDVTAHISMERRLAVSERLAAVGKLAARVAHELNNPLDGILRFTNLAIRRAREAAADQAGADEKLLSYLENIRSAVVRMSEITGDLLEFSRSTPSAFEQATINRIAEDAVRAMEGRAQERGITVVCNFSEHDVPVARGSNLFQVFCNLIKNAVDAMGEEGSRAEGTGRFSARAENRSQMGRGGGTLTVSTRVCPPDVIVTVADTGVGLPPEAERIFEPFFTTKPAGQGTGLGLAVCKDLIEKYAGTITAAPNEPRGTVMTVRIPVANCSAVPGVRGRTTQETR